MTILWSETLLQCSIRTLSGTIILPTHSSPYSWKYHIHHGYQLFIYASKQNCNLNFNMMKLKSLYVWWNALISGNSDSNWKKNTRQIPDSSDTYPTGKECLNSSFLNACKLVLELWQTLAQKPKFRNNVRKTTHRTNQVWVRLEYEGFRTIIWKKHFSCIDDSSWYTALLQTGGGLVLGFHRSGTEPEKSTSILKKWLLNWTNKIDLLKRVLKES